MDNILSSAGVAGTVNVGTYTTDADPVFSMYNASPNVDIGIVTATSVNSSGVITATTGFISMGATTPIKITLSGNILSFTAVGIGSTFFRLA
jgi:hypothetical protein